MLKEYQDAARKEERQKLLAKFMPAVAGMVVSLTLIFVSQYTNLFSPISSLFISSDMTGQSQSLSKNNKS